MRKFIRIIESVIITICSLSFCYTIYLWIFPYFNNLTGLDIRPNSGYVFWLLIAGIVLLIIGGCVRVVKSKKQDIIAYKGRKAMSSVMTTISILNVISSFFLLYVLIN
jgi:hypothetical protein